MGSSRRVTSVLRVDGSSDQRRKPIPLCCSRTSLDLKLHVFRLFTRVFLPRSIEEGRVGIGRKALCHILDRLPNPILSKRRCPRELVIPRGFWCPCLLVKEGKFARRSVFQIRGNQRRTRILASAKSMRCICRIVEFELTYGVAEFLTLMMRDARFVALASPVLGLRILNLGPVW